ncbi:very late expression factor 1 [Helicoverpa zea nudivirus 2]|uniref:Very late expression factor 1 n=1 Tax=Helicoverpa zea nudivirus 2 TaxID=1128424 RepID=G9I054_HZNV2|nr:orf28 gene product [Helicoverpa zea nudivirus 2]AEW69577.1 very late expression factor 1 [Helicoverpa zea nudivirus 2]
MTSKKEFKVEVDSAPPSYKPTTAPTHKLAQYNPTHYKNTTTPTHYKPTQYEQNQDRLQFVKFSDSHIRAIRYAFNFLQRANESLHPGTELDLAQLTAEQLAELLVSQKDKYRNTTIVQIARIVKFLDRDKYRKILSMIIPKVGWVRPKRTALYKKMDIVTHNAIERLVLDVTSEPWLYPELSPSIILCICTNLRMNELQQLTRKSLMDIVEGRKVNIKIKKRSRFIRVLYIRDILLKFLDFLTSHTNEDSDRIVTVSRSTLNKMLRSALLERGASPDELFGIQSIRVFNTTRMIANLPLGLVARFNRHRRMETTSHFYDSGNVVFEKEFREFV